MTDIATRIRERCGEWVENCLYPQAMAHAVEAVLDELGRLSAHGDHRIMHIIGNLYRAIADELGISDSPTAAVGEPTPDWHRIAVQIARYGGSYYGLATWERDALEAEVAGENEREWGVGWERRNDETNPGECA